MTTEFGVVPVRLPDIPDKLLHMVVARGLGRQPMILLTTLAKSTSREANHERPTPIQRGDFINNHVSFKHRHHHVATSQHSTIKHVRVKLIQKSPP